MQTISFVLSSLSSSLLVYFFFTSSQLMFIFYFFSRVPPLFWLYCTHFILHLISFPFFSFICEVTQLLKDLLLLLMFFDGMILYHLIINSEIHSLPHLLRFFTSGLILEFYALRDLHCKEYVGQFV